MGDHSARAALPTDARASPGRRMGDRRGADACRAPRRHRPRAPESRLYGVLPTFDGHKAALTTYMTTRRSSSVALAGHLDFPRMRLGHVSGGMLGRVRGGIFAIFTPPSGAREEPVPRADGVLGVRVRTGRGSRSRYRAGLTYLRVRANPIRREHRWSDLNRNCPNPIVGW